jgi:hypothetical protein
MMMMMMMMATIMSCNDMTVVTLDVLRAVGIKMTVFCDVTPCNLVDNTDVSKGLAASVLYREVGGHRVFRNVGTKLSNCMASHTKRLSYCYQQSCMSISTFWAVTSQTVIQSVAVLRSGKELCYAFMVYSAQMPNSFVRQSACLYVGPYNVLYSNALVFACGHAWPAGKEAHFIAGMCICPNRRSAVVVPLFCERRTVHFLLILCLLFFQG